MTPTDKPMTVEALMTLVNRYAEACDDLGADLFAQDATKHAALHEAASAVYAQIRAAIEQYGREREESGFECGVLAEFKATERQAGRESDEPVAWGQLGTLNGRLFLRSNYDRAPYPPPPSIVRNLNLVPLYAAQPRVPLTDEQIISGFEADDSLPHVYSGVRIWREAIKFAERAHNIRSAK